MTMGYDALEIQQDRVADPQKKFELGATGGAKADSNIYLHRSIIWIAL